MHGVHAGAAIFALVSTLVGCTLEPGGGFARLESAELAVSFELGRARDAQGAMLTDRGYLVDIEELVLGLDVLELVELAGAENATSGGFDPGAPPDGYTTCHGGHCHSEDGRLVPYADIEAELAGGAARFVPVARLPIGADTDLRRPSTHALERVEPSRELPECRLAKAVLRGSRLTLRGSVRTLGDDQRVPLEIALDAEPTFTAPLSLTLDRDGPRELRLSARLALDGALLDGIELGELERDGRLELTDPDSTEGATLSRSLAGYELELAW